MGQQRSNLKKNIADSSIPSSVPLPSSSPQQYAKPNQSGSGSPAGQKDHPDEGTFTKDIDINDSRNRYLLTRGSTQDEVRAPLPRLHSLPACAQS